MQFGKIMSPPSNDRNSIVKLEDIPNIGTSIAGDLRLLGIDHPQQLVGQDAYELFDRLCEKTGVRHDPCVIDCFLSAVRFMEGGPKTPWWHFTDERKRHLSQLHSDGDR